MSCFAPIAQCDSALFIIDVRWRTGRMTLRWKKMDALPTPSPELRTVSPVRIRSFALSAQDHGEAKHSLRSRRVDGGISVSVGIYS